jgi:hypothetical protein
MKALTLRPHWAWLVVNGFKDIENRSWPTHVRGRIWIHASSSRVTCVEYERFLGVCEERRIKKFPQRENFQIGGIVGSVEIMDCVTASRSYWFSGEYGFVLKKARKTPFRPMKGRLGFFEVTSRLAPTDISSDCQNNNYVAYHSADIMGYEYGPGPAQFRFFSRKSRKFLERSIGCDVWVVTGTRNQKRKMVYRLAAVYQPDEVRDCRGCFHVLGKRGCIFRSPVELNDAPWFQTLFREQNRFSFGFNRIQAEAVVKALRELREKDSAKK